MAQLSCLKTGGLLATCLLQNLHPALADPPPFHQSSAYDNGSLGIFVGLNFTSSSFTAPRINIKAWDAACDANDMYTFFCPRGLLTPTVGPVIMNRQGHMVWHRSDFGNTYNLQVQKLRGEDVLTFWAGDDNVVGHGSGYYYILDTSYRLISKISAIGPTYHGDLHEFIITPNNTALLTIYEKVQTDMRHWDPALPASGWVWDCLFQEITLTPTPELLFEWRASSHFAYSDCPYHRPDPSINDGGYDTAFDWFHINSVAKDDRGNYLISARYSRAITYISGATGTILWHLGGHNNSFYDLSAGHATNFKWQHDARWHADGTQISLFDNAAYFGDHGSPARGMLVAIDEEAMTAKLVREFYHPEFYFSESQGSMQMVDVNEEGDAFVGWGNTPAWTQFRADGSVRCDVQFGALKWREDGGFGQGAVMSYRTYRGRWKGWPVEMPKVAFKEGTFFVSWNGATEVRKWLLEDSVGSGLENFGVPPAQRSEREWSRVAEFPWHGFESSCRVETGPTDARNHLEYRLTAIDVDSATLGSWIVDTAGVVLPIGYDANETHSREAQERLLRTSRTTTLGTSTRQLMLVAIIGAMVGALLTSRRSSAGFLGLVTPKDGAIVGKMREV